MTDLPTPPSVSSIDTRLNGVHRARWLVVTLVFTMMALAVCILVFVVIRQQAEISSSCDFYAPLTGLSPAVTPQTHRPSKIGVSIISGARIAYGGEGCGRPLPPAPAGLQHWERYYHITR